MEQRIFSFAGKILRVDLTSGKIWTETTIKYAQKFLGGRGVDNWILYDEVKPWVAPFDPANRLIFGTGVLVGTLAPTAARHSVDAKSPMTGGIGSANSCRHFSAELKFAGYDAVFPWSESRIALFRPCVAQGKFLDLSANASFDSRIFPDQQCAVMINPQTDALDLPLPLASTHRAAGQYAVLLPPLPHSCRVRFQQLQVGRKGL